MVMTPLRVELSSAQVAELWWRLRRRDLVPNERMRLECVRLAAHGRTSPVIASVVEWHVVTVRKALHQFLDRGFEALADAPRPGRPPRWTRKDLDALEEMLTSRPSISPSQPSRRASAARSWRWSRISDQARALGGVGAQECAADAGVFRRACRAPAAPVPCHRFLMRFVKPRGPSVARARSSVRRAIGPTER
ncbi:helix-turn-helix domain-containing protein [Streptomyces sp. NPDC021093]|uniref:helix-turn-helix domain-containing protein n=1 Tax=Streptomyces sp. NPDC021093 TaxID=3365112 RepID=UPI0037B9FDB6